jgi:UDPglucose 6-dehydrogenase
MKIAVQGLWHLGVVTTAGLWALGFDVIALDYDEKIITGLEQGRLPVVEPGVSELLEKAKSSERICFTFDKKKLEECQIFWLAYDTPVNEEDIADVEFVFSEFKKSVKHLHPDAYILVSSQLPVGSARLLKETANSLRPANNFRFAVQPENLRLGKSLESFLEAERIIVGTESSKPEEVLEKLYSKFNTRIIWMSLESAEMTKHAINAFLATSITFMGEISDICELVSANARDVELGLRSDSRIGNKAYVSPGLGFAGGTLARDVKFLEAWQKDSKGMLSSVIESNRVHNEWIQRSFTSFFQDRGNLNILFMGLTYTEDTGTLRRSAMLGYASKLLDCGHNVTFFEDQEIELPEHLHHRLKQAEIGFENVLEVDAIILSKKMRWLDDDNIVNKIVNSKAVIFDPAGLLLKLRQDRPSSSHYFTVGQINER